MNPNPADWQHPLKYAQVEEERRFLLRSLPSDLSPDAAYVRIVDHYLPDTRLRLRRLESPTGEVLVLKLGQKFRAADQSTRQTTMTNFYLDETEYAILSTLGGALLVKRRYPYHHAGHNYNIDVFERHLSGLILMEIERRPGVDLSALPLPSVALREVTDDPFFTGGALATLSLANFQRWLTAHLAE